MSLSKNLVRPTTTSFEPRLNKNQLSTLGTILGLTAGIATVLGTQQVIDPKIAGTVSGIATVFLGYVVQQPATERPTTNEEEEKNIGG
jgi:hypothetical protein